MREDFQVDQETRICANYRRFLQEADADMPDWWVGFKVQSSPSTIASSPVVRLQRLLQFVESDRPSIKVISDSTRWLRSKGVPTPEQWLAGGRCAGDALR